MNFPAAASTMRDAREPDGNMKDAGAELVGILILHPTECNGGDASKVVTQR